MPPGLYFCSDISHIGIRRYSRLSQTRLLSDTAGSAAAEIAEKVQKDKVQTPAGYPGIGLLVSLPSGLVPVVAVLQMLLELAVLQIAGFQRHSPGSVLSGRDKIAEALMSDGAVVIPSRPALRLRDAV